MDWNAIGAIGEVIGGVGVIFTLFYLALQIRQNTKATQKQSFRDAMEFIYTSSNPLIQDPILAELYLRGMNDFHSLDDAEKVRFHYLCTTRLQAAQTSADLMSEQGVQLESIHEWVERMMRNEGFRIWWLERGQFVVNADFRAFGEKLRAEVEQRGEELSFAETYKS